MKKLLIFSLLLTTSLVSLAQDKEDEEEVKKGFKKENLFLGGSLQLSFSNNFTALGISPYFGYSINRFVDVAASVGVNYISQRDNISLDDRYRQTTYGPGAFVRLFPVKFLFAQVQYEHNFIKQTYKYPNTFNLPDEKNNVDVNSVLVGGGFAGGRDRYNKSFYYFSVMWDVSRLPNSPYTDNQNRAVPVIRAGYNIALFQ